jgi:hypothetical protein
MGKGVLYAIDFSHTHLPLFGGNISDVPAVARDLSEFTWRKVGFERERGIIVTHLISEYQRIITAYGATYTRGHQRSQGMAAHIRKHL